MNWVETDWNRIELGRNRNVDNPGNYTLDRVSIWNVARTQNEIQNDVFNGHNGDEDGLLVYWTADAGEGEILYDHSGNANHATIYGASWVEETASLFIPSISVSPNSIEDELYLGEISQHAITIYNEGDADLDWQINLSNSSSSMVIASSETFGTEINQSPVLKTDDQVMMVNIPTAENIFNFDAIPYTGARAGTIFRTFDRDRDGNLESVLQDIDQNFETIDQLQKHYKLFVERVQHQLATFGGGGEVNLQYMDDITGIATNLSAYDGMYLRLDTSQPAGKNFVFETVASAGAGGTWGVGSAGISTTKNVGIGTTAKSDYALDVEGNARITGIVTVGRSTITLNPNTNIVTVGTGITLDSTNNQILIGGSKVADSSGDANYTGIITASEFKGNLTGNVTGDVSGNITGSACTITTGNFTNVTIGGTLTYEDVTNIDSVGLITARSGVDFGSSGIVRIESVSSTKTSTSQAAIDTFDAETWQSGSYQIQIRRGTAYHITSLNLVHSGGTVYMTEFGTIKTGVSLATFDSDINSGNVRILATPSSSDSTVFKMSRTLITS